MGELHLLLGLARLKLEMFLQAKPTSLRAANPFCFVLEVVAFAPCSTKLKIPISLGKMGSTCWKSQSSAL